MFGKNRAEQTEERKILMNRETQVMLKVADILLREQLITPDENMKLTQMIREEETLS